MRGLPLNYKPLFPSLRALFYLLLLCSTLAPACQPKQRVSVKRPALAPDPLLLHLTQLVARQTITPDSLDRLSGSKGDYRAGHVGGAPVLFVGWGDLELDTTTHRGTTSLHITALSPDPAIPYGQPGWRGLLPYTLPALRTLLGPWEEGPASLTKEEKSRTYSVWFCYQDPQTHRRARVRLRLDSLDRSAQARIHSIRISSDSH